MRKGGSREAYCTIQPTQLINAALHKIREWEAGPYPSGGAHPFRNICKGVKKEVNGELPNPRTWIFSYHSVIDAGLVSHPAKSIEKGQAFFICFMK